ncbi:hypothetical protein LCGC14_2002550 [marine sediment metagenome]|uniref:HTH cro/C1-type domain-containing protein n=1 Tax=marine sediment metagenome TaxID=412755 RepID=A0A0F9HG24_9ZZZZ
MVYAMSIPELVGVLVKRYGSLNAASRETKIPLTTLFRLHSGEHKEATYGTLRKIAVALGQPLHEVVRQLEAGDEATEVVSSR